MLADIDHRKIGSQLDLFHFRPEAPGMVFWHPRGFSLYRALEEAIRREMRRQGIHEVRSPQLLRQNVWEASGHWSHFRENMFQVNEDRAAALKPVSCPAHLYIAKAKRISHRDLPLRLGEIGLVHRNEQSGNLHGLFRLRQFSQDDGHILCAPEHVADEVASFCRRLVSFYELFGFENLEVGFSSRPPDRLGSDEVWDRAEALLREAAVHAELDVIEQEGEGAFYGPKLEFSLEDCIGRRWQCGTIQLDLVMPERFDLGYADAGDRRVRPMLLHRALLGSLERFLGILLENCGGSLPPWLAPEQVLVVPVGEEQLEKASAWAARLEAAGLRPRVDARPHSVGHRIRSAHEMRIPLVAVLGPREARSSAVALRHDGAPEVVPEEEAVARAAALCAAPI
jgi:threonyl-tRNA synthetase